MTSFYNTIELNGSDLDRAKKRADTQESKVLAFFNLRPAYLYTPFEVQEKVMPGVPITSVRRAITNLEKAGHLRKTKVRGVGKYGVPNYCWQLAQPRHGHVQTSLFGG